MPSQQRWGTGHRRPRRRAARPADAWAAAARDNGIGTASAERGSRGSRARSVRGVHGEGVRAPARAQAPRSGARRGMGQLPRATGGAQGAHFVCSCVFSVDRAKKPKSRETLRETLSHPHHSAHDSRMRHSDRNPNLGVIRTHSDPFGLIRTRPAVAIRLALHSETTRVPRAPSGAAPARRDDDPGRATVMRRLGAHAVAGVAHKGRPQDREEHRGRAAPPARRRTLRHSAWSLDSASGAGLPHRCVGRFRCVGRRGRGGRGHARRDERGRVGRRRASAATTG